MLVNCMNCNKEFNKKNHEARKHINHYCSRSCAAIKNNQNPKIWKNRRKKTKRCLCGELIFKSRKRCPTCIKNAMPPDLTLKEAIYYKHKKSSAFALVRSRARTVANQFYVKSCAHCGYDKHVEIAHIKPISSFPLDTKLSVINDPDNLIPLCPNCHWEFDNQQ